MILILDEEYSIDPKKFIRALSHLEEKRKTKMNNTLRVLQKTKTFKETGSPLDTTDITAIHTRAGSHDNIPSRPVDPSAFSHSKRIDKVDPHKFVRRGEGNGGTMVRK